MLLKDISEIDIYSLIQHYGGATRLIDFTRSIYIAAFFACCDYKNYDYNSIVEKQDQYAVIWAVDLYKLKHAHAYFWGVTNICNQKSTLKEYDDIAKEKNAPIIFDISTSFMNKRQAAQQGLYLFSTSRKQSFQNCLLDTFQKSSMEAPSLLNLKGENYQEKLLRASIIKILIPNDARNIILEGLYKSNVHWMTLFPDLTGLAKYSSQIHLSHSHAN